MDVKENNTSEAMNKQEIRMLSSPWIKVEDVQGIPPTNYFYIYADNNHSPVAWNPEQTQYALKMKPYTYIEAKLFHEQHAMWIFTNFNEKCNQ